MLTLETLKLLQQTCTTQELNALSVAAMRQELPLAVPNGFAMTSLEKFSPARYRARGTMDTKNAGDFADYVNTNCVLDEFVRIFVDADAMRATAILNWLIEGRYGGHCDNTATLTLEKTAAFKALQAVDGKTQTQLAAAEFFEDFAPMLKFFGKDAEGNSTEMSVAKAVAAVRKLSIDTSKKLESQQDQLSASKSTFDSVRVANEAFPSHVYFECVPYHGLASRTFVLRIGVITTGPAIVLRSIHMEQHNEDMAQDFVALIADKAKDIPVITGTYKTAA